MKIPAHKSHLVWWFIATSLLVACGNELSTPTSHSLVADTPTSLPTPTLAGVLASLTPAPSLSITSTLVAHLPSISPSPSPTVTPIPLPTATPKPAERLILGAAAIDQQDFATAIEHLEQGLATAPLTLPAKQETQLALGKAYLAEEDYEAAITTFRNVLATAGNTDAAYFLATALVALGDCTQAIPAYETYLAGNPELIPYIQPRIGDCYFILGNRPAGFAAYELAGNAPSHRLYYVTLHETLANLYIEEQDYANALRHYEAILSVAQTPFTKGQTLKLAGDAEVAQGNLAAGYEYYRTAINNYPTSYDSYLSLIQLLDAGIPVDPYQRGVVDYHAGAYYPAIDVLTEYITNNPDTYRADAWLYLAWSYEEIGEMEKAFAQLEQYMTVQPDRAQLEQAKLMARAGNLSDAINTYLLYVATYPNGTDAPFALQQAGLLTERLGNMRGAITHYRRLFANYAWHEDTPRFLFRAGFLAWQLRDSQLAQQIWEEGVNNYPTDKYGAAAFIWLSENMPATSTALSSINLASQHIQDDNYYTLRAQEVIAGNQPFTHKGDFIFPDIDEQVIQMWMQTQFGLASGEALAQLPASVRNDGRLQRGEKLWRLELYQQALTEWESLRAEYAQDAPASYALALYFQAQGNYQSSILAAQAVWRLSQQSIFAIPPSLARLIYPAYYHELIVAFGESYGYDPLLQFALVRQESLFNSFATSGAVAQGLSQVIPDTGTYIARRLGWQDYENSDLYRPYVGLAFGAYYLDEQLSTFGGNVYAALSAYNAGPGNAQRWVEQAGNNPDLYVEVVNFSETRAYIERIYVGYMIYQHLYTTN